MGEYLGFKDIVMNDIELANIYGDASQNNYECLQNEYIIIRDETGKVVDCVKWNGNKFVRVQQRKIDSKYGGKVKARNVQQQLAIDLLFDRDITVKMLAGKYGTGKDFLMCAAAIELLEKGEFEKIVYVRNNIEVKDSKPIGHLPGSHNDKLMPYTMVLSDHVGGLDSLQRLIDDGKIEIAHLGFIRGRDIKNSIVYCSEAENMTKEHFQLLLGRIGEGSALWINGDCRQTDMDVFKNNSGMKIALEKLKGHPRFGYVQLLKTERSETAAMADLLD